MYLGLFRLNEIYFYIDLVEPNALQVQKSPSMKTDFTFPK